MCVGVPMLVVEIVGDRAKARLGDTEREVGLALLPETQVGEYVIVHAGFAVQRLSEDDALETLHLLAEIQAQGD